MQVVLSERLDERERQEWAGWWRGALHAHPRQHPALAGFEEARGARVVYARTLRAGRLAAVAVLGLRPAFPGSRTPGEAVCLRGPAFDELDAGRRLLVEVVRSMHERGAGGVRISPYWYFPEAESAAAMIRDLGFSPVRDAPRESTGRIALGPPAEQILAACSRTTRYEIRAAARRGVEVRPLVAQEEFDAAWRALADLRVERGLHRLGRPEFEALVRDVFAAGELGTMLGAFRGEDFLGVLSLLRSAHTAHPAHYAVLPQAARERGLPTVGPSLWWQAVLWAREHSLAFLDMEGRVAADGGESLAGFEHFKGRFRAAPAERIGEHAVVCSAFARTLHRAAAAAGYVRRRTVAALRRRRRGGGSGRSDPAHSSGAASS